MLLETGSETSLSAFFQAQVFCPFRIHEGDSMNFRKEFQRDRSDFRSVFLCRQQFALCLADPEMGRGEKSNVLRAVHAVFITLEKASALTNLRANAYHPRTVFILNPTPAIMHRAMRFCARWQDLSVNLQGAPPVMLTA